MPAFRTMNLNGALTVIFCPSLLQVLQNGSILADHHVVITFTTLLELSYIVRSTNLLEHQKAITSIRYCLLAYPLCGRIASLNRDSCLWVIKDPKQRKTCSFHFQTEQKRKVFIEQRPVIFSPPCADLHGDHPMFCFFRLLSANLDVRNCKKELIRRW